MAKWQYGVILDAGSSGTRAYVYRWLNPVRSRATGSAQVLESLPELKTKKHWTKKIHPGVSTFGEKPEEVGSEHLKPLIDHALKYVPQNQVKDTPLFLLATAGMRLLPDNQRQQVLSNICSFTREYSDFQIPDCDLHIQVIPGETEGLYGWIAANYLLGGFDKPQDHDHGKGHHTYGFLDMGGASAQIAFAPNTTETEKHANDLKLLRLRTLNGKEEEFKVFVTTWLGFGANQARRRYIEALQHSVDMEVKELPDPCLPVGLKLTMDGKPVAPESPEANGDAQYLLGTGRFPECLRQTFPLLEKEKPCDDDPCLLGGKHVPAIDFDVNHFVGVSEYWHTTHQVFEMSHEEKAYDFHTYQDRVKEFCSQPWDAIEKGVKKHKWGKKVDESTAEEVCFKASWLINMLHDGIGVPRVGIEHPKQEYNVTEALGKAAKAKGFLDPFQAVDKIEDVEVSWTLGKMVLYASSQVPPLSDSNAVGYGSNVEGVPEPQDFQRPAFSEAASLGAEDDWVDTLFLDSPRRVPGFLLFMLIVCVAAFLLCGRERRNTLLARFCSAFGPARCKRSRKASTASPSRFGKFFGMPSQAYERVPLDSGEAAAEFELGGYDSEEDVGVAGRASGWATPKLVVDPPSDAMGSPGKRAAALDHGMLVRAESRDNLAAGLEARINRSRSPAQRSTLSKGVLE